MPTKDLEDFSDYWNLSFTNKDGSPKQPGGNPKNGGVDYGKYLIPWCKGNSISVDQSTLSDPRDLISMLVENYAANLRKKDSGEIKILDHRCGVTLDNLKQKFGKPFTKRTRKFAGGEKNPTWDMLEMLLQAMLGDGNIALFSDDNSLHPQQEDIAKTIRNNGHLHKRGEQMHISNALEQSAPNGHVRLSRMKGWELYIRDHYGVPDGVKDFMPGDMSGGAPQGSGKTMTHPLHLVYAETMARAMSRGSVWGKNQSVIRRKICDSAIEGNGTSIPLDDYYVIFARNGAAHMADYFLQRSIGDIAAATYELVVLPDSDPRAWEVRLDPDLVRWRENRRERMRERI